MRSIQLSAVAQQYNTVPSIERAGVRIIFAAVSKLGHFRSLHDAPVHCINDCLAIESCGNVNE